MSLGWGVCTTPLGRLALGFDRRGRLHIAVFGDDARGLQRALGARGRRVRLERSPPPRTIASPLVAYFDGDLEALSAIPIALMGTPFQRRVWRALRRIPAGTTRSYGELARRLDSGARAVGRANGLNPIAVVVPCHRLVGSDGALTGYGGGLDRKRWLLAHERATGST